MRFNISGALKGRLNARRPALAVVAVFLALLMMFPSLPLFYRPSDQINYNGARPEKEMPGADSDKDGLYNNIEKDVGTKPYDPDTDGDGLQDGQEYQFWLTRMEMRAKENESAEWLKEKYPRENHDQLSRRYGPKGDLDGDDLSNIVDPDSDGDGVDDGTELAQGTDPDDPGQSKPSDKPIPTPPPVKPNNTKNDTSPTTSNLSASSMTSSSFRNVTESDTQVLFWVEPVDKPRYWRTAAFDLYSDGSWSLSRTDQRTYVGERLAHEIIKPDNVAEDGFKISFNGDGTGFLPNTLHATRLYGADPVDIPVSVDGMHNFYTPEFISSYHFDAWTSVWSPRQLEAGTLVSAASRPDLVQLPDSVTGRTRELSAALTEGQNISFARIVTLLGYLKANYAFDRTGDDVPMGAEPVDHFLFTSRKGGALEFATAFVVLCRSAGIPSRLATGFAIGEVLEGKRAVRAAHYHAWAEVLFSELGWVQLETSSADNVMDPGHAGASGADPSVGDISFVNGTAVTVVGAAGGGTTMNETVVQDATLTNINFTIQYDVRPMEIWKGRVFWVNGTLVAPSELRAGAAISVYMDYTDQLVGRGHAGPNGSFSVVCNADSVQVGEKKIGVSASMLRRGLLYMADTPPSKYKNALLCSNTTLDLLCKDFAIRGKDLSFSVRLRDRGNLTSPFTEWVNIEWNGSHKMRMDATLEDELKFEITDPPGRYNLTARYEGSTYLAASNATRNISVKSGGLKMEFGVVNTATPKVGDTLFVEVYLTDEARHPVAANVSVSLDNQLVAAGPAGSIFPIKLDPSTLGGGVHRLAAFFAGSEIYPELTAEQEVRIRGLSNIVLPPQNISLGRQGYIKGSLIDNLGYAIGSTMTGQLNVSWTDTLGFPGWNNKMSTSNEGEFTVKFDARPELPPGGMLVKARYNGDGLDYEGCSNATYVQLTSPSFINATMAKNLTRGEQFILAGYLYDHLRRPIPRAVVSLKRGESNWGLGRADDTGNFSLVCEVPGLEPTGPALVELSYAGEGNREQAINRYNVSVFTLCYINLTIPGGLQQGGGFSIVAVLKDDRGIPVPNENLTAQFAGGRQKVRTDAFGKATFDLRFPWYSTQEGLKVDYQSTGFRRSASASASLKAEPVILYRALAVIAVVLAAAGIYYLYRRYMRLSGRDELPPELRDLSWMSDRYRKTIYKVYTRMLVRMGVLGARREASWTVREYERELAGALTLDLQSLGLLTLAFEEARYSRHRLTGSDSQRAVVSFRKLMNSVQVPGDFKALEPRAAAPGNGGAGRNGGNGRNGAMPGPAVRPAGPLRNAV